MVLSSPNNEKRPKDKKGPRGEESFLAIEGLPPEPNQICRTRLSPYPHLEKMCKFPSFHKKYIAKSRRMDYNRYNPKRKTTTQEIHE